MTSILIVADIRLYREGLAQVLARQSSFRLTGTAGDAHSAIAQLRGQHPDMVLVDMAMSASVDVVRAIRESAPETKVVALSVAESEADVWACAEAGVTGYVGRDASLADLIPRMAGSLLRRLAELAIAQPLGTPSTHLTRREQEILRLLDEGLANKEIARRLGIEVATVKNHVHNILDKLQVHRRAEAAAIMRKVLRTNPTPHLTAAG